MKIIINKRCLRVEDFITFCYGLSQTAKYVFVELLPVSVLFIASWIKRRQISLSFTNVELTKKRKFQMTTQWHIPRPSLSSAGSIDDSRSRGGSASSQGSSSNHSTHVSSSFNIQPLLCSNYSDRYLRYKL